VAVPKVRVENRSTHAVFIEGDPNWDDQVLLVSGKALRGSHEVGKGSRATISQRGWGEEGDVNMMGVIFSDSPHSDGPGAGSYQLTIGQNPNLGVTDSFSWGEPRVAYTVNDQTPWSMTMTFADAAATQGEPANGS
jgi:hypothetical protein